MISSKVFVDESNRWNKKVIAKHNTKQNVFLVSFIIFDIIKQQNSLSVLIHSVFAYEAYIYALQKKLSWLRY